MLNGKSKSCGCLRKEIHYNHGQFKSRLYNIWTNMKQRCYNKKNTSYENYGGRGIKVCKEWQSDFESFYLWSVDNGYSDLLQIDRIDNNADYSPKNCRWISRKLQNRNRRNNLHIEFIGVKKTLKEWSEFTLIKQCTLDYRINAGWDLDRVFLTST